MPLPGSFSGLDPAKPGFENVALEEGRLDLKDAYFVDVIHTSAGLFGYYSAIGHVDFYPNNGFSPQPGCRLGTYFWDSGTCPITNRIICKKMWLVSVIRCLNTSLNNDDSFSVVDC